MTSDPHADERQALQREERELFNHLATAKPSDEARAKLHRYRAVLRRLEELGPPPPPAPEPGQLGLFEEARP